LKFAQKEANPKKNSFIKPKNIAYKLKQKQNAPPTFSMEKEGGVGKGFLRTTTKKGITITNLTKKHPTHPLN
jgi:hypothetical protein